MKRSLTAGIYLDFGTLSNRAVKSVTFRFGDQSPVSSATTGEANFFSLTAVGKLLDEFASINHLRPLVILDVPTHPVLNEAVIQLMLRNAFASELYRMGNASAVLATGLTQPYGYGGMPLIIQLISSLAEGRNLGEIVREIRSTPLDRLRSVPQNRFTSGETLEGILGHIGTALFTHNPTSLNSITPTRPF
jgi:hypothetical protein